VSAVDQKLLRRFLKSAGDRLRGDWVLMGGAVLPLLGIEHRVTWDIDVAGPHDAAADQLLVLMEIAEQLGLPVEAINQAGAYFLQRIDGWEEHLVAVHEGKRARMFRPDVTLFLLLKISRLSESDLADCLAMLQYARASDEQPDVRRLKRWIRRQSKLKDTSRPKRDRLGVLLEALGG
jgi:hypothetical protein